MRHGEPEPLTPGGEVEHAVDDERRFPGAAATAEQEQPARG